MATHAELARAEVVGRRLADLTGEVGWLESRAELITGGRSNLTYHLISPAGELILRRPPSGGILATAHDMSRETRVQKALADTGVPVPRIVLEDEGELIGAPFYVMTKVDGLVIRDAVPPGFAREDRRRLGEGLVDMLATLHRVDPTQVGLGDFGRPEGFAERQVRRWRRQIDATPVTPPPGLQVLAGRLERKLPREQPGRVLHGDFRLDNCLMDEMRPGRVNAVLDWEMSTLGDPLTDLGVLLFYWDSVARLGPELVTSVTTQPGFPASVEVAERWSEGTGTPIDQLDWYRAFAHFKFAGIVLGIQARVNAGAMAGQDFGDLSGAVRSVVAAGLDIPVI